MPTRSRRTPKNEPKPPEPKRWLTAKEAAEYTGYSIGWMRQMRAIDQGPRFVKTPTGQVRYRPSDLEAWLTGETA